MAIKEIKREWSPCQLDYVKTYLLHSEKDVADLPKCCVGSKATVSETDNEYFCTVDGWKLSTEIAGGSSSGGNAGGGVALVKMSCETTDMQTFTNITASKTYDELKEVYDADGLLWCRLTITMGEDGTASAECPLSGAQHDGDIKLFQFAPLGPLSNMGIVVYIDGDDRLGVGVS